MYYAGFKLLRYSIWAVVKCIHCLLNSDPSGITHLIGTAVKDIRNTTDRNASVRGDITNISHFSHLQMLMNAYYISRDIKDNLYRFSETLQTNLH
ncbi:hypothetical protein SEEN185_19746 [Salmonella enterica subsp. enterica serovar Newport str. CVM 35185]|nr:hypothetical protein SEEN185_19746 [Salmonella enterica subsp. enterica serovar Newport str. CVM 35185]